MNLDKEMEALSNIINEAIIHGGDIGGPYFCNEKNLIESIQTYLSLRGLDSEFEIVFVDYNNEEQEPDSYSYGCFIKIRRKQ